MLDWNDGGGDIDANCQHDKSRSVLIAHVKFNPKEIDLIFYLKLLGISHCFSLFEPSQ